MTNTSREILIKVVAQATPTYTMSYFKLLDSMCLDLNSMMGSFWWGKKENERKLALVLWKRLCSLEIEGGMGFSELKAFNMALLVKQG